MIEQMDMNYWKYCRKSNIEYINKNETSKCTDLCRVDKATRK